MFGWFASTASAGSFCLFCANGVGGLPTVTCVSGLTAEAGVAVTATRAMSDVERRMNRREERFVMRPPRVLAAMGNASDPGERQRPDTHYAPRAPPASARSR